MKSRIGITWLCNYFVGLIRINIILGIFIILMHNFISLKVIFM